MISRKNSFYVGNREPLPASAFSFLPLGSIKPKGWLKKQLRIQADSLSGHLPDFWPSLGPESGWLGGAGESWERGPYYLDGLVPLAYLLEDDKLISMVQKWLAFSFDSQDELGHFGPQNLTDWWPYAPMLKALTQYQEVTGDTRVIPLLTRFFNYMKNQLPSNHMHSWAVVRWADMAVSIIWLYNRSGDPALLELADEVMRQGYDWTWHFSDFAHPNKQRDKFVLRTHVVNNAMAIKSPAIAYLLTRWKEHYEGASKAIWLLDHYHGSATGIFTGDEHYAGKDPTQGTELCAVVEYMYSLEHLIQIYGDTSFGDRLEKITYNALPGTFTADMWAHQYDQQANQVLCSVAPRHWTNNREDSNIFGLEPNFGCCTANLHQGWPKFVANLWMATPDDGLAAVAYGPCEIEATVRGGKRVKVEVETKYPFEEDIEIAVHAPEDAEEFPIHLRIPEWAEGARCKVGNECINATPGQYLVLNRKWDTSQKINLNFPMKVEAERRYREAVTLKRGPLVYSLKIGERWEKIKGEEPHCDYAVHPTTPWNYGLVIDPENPQAEVVKKTVGDVIYGPDFAPIELKVKGKIVPQWQMEDDCAGPIPEAPVKSSEPVEEITLIPYGCAKLRITEFPLIEG